MLFGSFHPCNVLWHATATIVEAPPVQAVPVELPGFPILAFARLKMGSIPSRPSLTQFDPLFALLSLPSTQHQRLARTRPHHNAGLHSFIVYRSFIEYILRSLALSDRHLNPLPPSRFTLWQATQLIFIAHSFADSSERPPQDISTQSTSSQKPDLAHSFCKTTSPPICQQTIRPSSGRIDLSATSALFSSDPFRHLVRSLLIFSFLFWVTCLHDHL